VALCRALVGRTNANLAPAVIQGYAGVCLARTTDLPPDLRERALALARQACQPPEAEGSPSGQLLRGMIAYRQGRYAETCATLERAAEIRQPITRARALAFRGMADFRLGRVEEARRALGDAELALAKGPTGETGWWGVGLGQVAIDELRALLAAKTESKAGPG
jgi:tetratricopeptide (TPR) repeat protein